MLKDYNDAFLDFKKYSFNFKEIDIKDVFGYLSSTKKVYKGYLFYVKIVLKLINNLFIEKSKFDSTIMDTDQKNQKIETFA